MKHFITLENLEDDLIISLINDTINYKKNKKFPDLSKYYVSNLFFENSTRTKSSFEMAEKRTGMKVINFEADRSSMKKGETLYDTVKTLYSIGVDCFVIRHSQDKFYEELIYKIEAPIINGGDGCGDHPSQGLLDLVTIYEEFNRFENLNILIVGDVIHSRVAHSDAKILSRLGANIHFSTPDYWRDEKMNMGKYVSLDECIHEADVVMMLRNQKERHNQKNNEKNNEKHDPMNNRYQEDNFLEVYGLTKQRASKMKKNAIIMHPAPVNRNVEIDEDLIESQQSRIFTQMTNGVFARIAILNYVFNY